MQTKKAMIHALLDLLKEKNIDDISVKAIVEHANVSKASFYSYFRDKYDAMTSLYMDFLDEGHSLELSFFDGEGSLLTILKFMKQNLLYTQRLFESSGQNSFKQELINKTFNIHASQLRQKYHLPETAKTGYLIYSLFEASYACVAKWVMTGCQESCEMIASLVFDIEVRMLEKQTVF